jgi:hypothetical protein
MIQLQNEERVDRQQRLKEHLGLSTISELYRRLIDQEAEKRGLFYDPRAAQLPLGLPSPGEGGAAAGEAGAGGAGGAEKTAVVGTGSPRSFR